MQKEINGAETIVGGIDIGGSHITAALVNTETKSLLPHTYTRQYIDSSGTADTIIDDWAAVIRTAFEAQELQPGRIGIAMPGPFDYERGISRMKNQNKYDALYGLDLKTLLAEKLRIDPAGIGFLNDAESFLKGELFNGVMTGYSRVLGFTLGTGFGSSKHDGTVTIDADLWCMPFKDSIAEDYFSTRWFVKRFQELSGRPIANVKELAELQEFKKERQQLFDEFTSNLIVFLLPLIEKYLIEAIVVGGNISKTSPFFLDQLNAGLHRAGFSTTVAISVLGEQASLLGAASYCESLGATAEHK